MEYTAINCTIYRSPKIVQSDQVLTITQSLMTKNNDKDKAEDDNDDNQALDVLASEGSNKWADHQCEVKGCVKKDSF